MVHAAVVIEQETPPGSVVVVAVVVVVEPPPATVAQDCLVADLIAVAGSLDPVMGDADR